MALEEQHSETGNIHSPLHSDGYQVTDPVCNVCVCVYVCEHWGDTLWQPHGNKQDTICQCVCVSTRLYVCAGMHM